MWTHQYCVSQELFMLLNKPFIIVIWIFLILHGAFVCLVTGRQANKNSVLMESTQIRQERVFVIKNSFTTTTLIILYGKGTVLTTFTHWVSTVNLGYLMFFGMFLKYHSLMCEHCGIACCLHFDWLPCCPQAWAVKMPSTSLITLQPHHFGPHRRLYDKSGRMAKKE